MQYVAARRRRRLLVAALTLAATAAFFAGAFGSGLIKAYDAPGNAGIVIGVECHNIGYEWRGAPGFFADSCD